MTDAVTQALLEREAKAWRELSPEEYEREVCLMLEDISSIAVACQRRDALLALATASLHRDVLIASESRGRCAAQLLAVFASVKKPESRLHVQQLFLLAWMQLARAVEQGPDAVSTSPPLPPGVELPDGAAASEIANPVLRAKAKELMRQHQQELVGWRAKQQALHHLNRLATIVRAQASDEDDLMQELTLAMSLAPGLPPELRRLLEQGH